MIISSLSHTHSLTHTHSLSLSHTHTHSLSLTHTHTHTLIHFTFLHGFIFERIECVPLFSSKLNFNQPCVALIVVGNTVHFTYIEEKGGRERERERKRERKGKSE